MSKAWKFGDNLNTDEIIPARYNITIDEKELAKKVFCEIMPDYAALVKPGDVVVGVIAASYARIFYRNSINIGLPILEAPEAAREIQDGDQVEVDLESGVIRNLTSAKTYQARPLPAFILQISRAGGIVNYLKAHDIEELM
jgi:3-isopropylmalate/(R)-2-methylmalate dehydratase small subunit